MSQNTCSVAFGEVNYYCLAKTPVVLQVCHAEEQNKHEPLTLLMKALTSDPSSCVISLFHRAVWCWTVRPPGSHTEPARWPPSSSLSFASPPSSAPPCVSHIPCGGTRKQAAQRGFNPLLFSSYYICNSGMFTSTLMLHEWNQVTYLFQWNHKCRIILKKTNLQHSTICEALY